MKKIFSLGLVAVFAVFLGAKDYAVDAVHSSVNFEVKHFTVSKVKGSFDKFSGVIGYDGKKITALNGEVEISSINTKNEGRDKHLQSADFFDAGKYPKGTLKFNSVKGDDLYLDLTLHGVTKKVKFDYEVNVGKNQQGKDIIGLSLEGEINRKDFKIGAGTPNVAVTDKVDIEIEIEGIAK